MKGLLWEVELLGYAKTPDQITIDYNLCRFDNLWWSYKDCVSTCGMGEYLVNETCTNKSSPNID